MKAFESCWGEDNVKLYTVNLKQAIAKCSQVDAPELSLPPFRSPYRYIARKIIIHGCSNKPLHSPPACCRA